jgi:L-fuconolactonase
VIVDAHHHLWDPARHRYPWMTGPAAALARSFDLGDLRAASAGLGVQATIVVEAARTEAETVELLAIAADPATPVAGVVGWVDLSALDVDSRLAALRAGPGGERLVAVRHPVEDEGDPGWLLQADVLRGLRAVAAAGLAYDLLVRPVQLEAARRAAELVDDLRFVLDHGGKPPIAAGAWEPWAADIARLAELDNVTCKLSGLVTEAHWERWRDDGVDRYAEHLLDCFGPARLMYGSDWPVCTLAASYADVVELAESVVARLSADERAAILAGTARDVYGGGDGRN